MTPDSLILGPLLKKAIDAAADWIPWPSRRQADFFTNQIEPLHEEFRRFKEAHMATFEEVREAVADPTRRLEEAREIVESKERRERESWMLFESFDRILHSTRASPNDLCYSYLADLRRCLVASRGEEPASIVYYRSLEEELASAIGRRAERGESESDQVLRREVIRNVDEIMLRFQKYVVSVETAYLILRGDARVR